MRRTPSASVLPSPSTATPRKTKHCGTSLPAGVSIVTDSDRDGGEEPVTVVGAEADDGVASLPSPSSDWIVVSSPPTATSSPVIAVRTPGSVVHHS